MLKRQYRLPAAVQLRNAVTLTTPEFLIKIVPNTLPYSRFGFVISKKVAKRAVVRNRSKRLLRFCVESQLRQITPGYDMLFLLKKQLTAQSSGVLCASVHTLLREKGYIR